MEKDGTQWLTRRNRGRFGRGWYHYSQSVPHVHQHPRARYQNGKFCRFWALVGCAPEERRKPTGQRCAYARRCPVGVAAPLGCVICLQLGDVAVFSLCAQYFLNVRGGGAITTLGAFHTFRKPCVARCRNGKLCRFLRSGGRSSPHDSYFLANTQNFLLAVPVANAFALWYDKFDKLELSN